MSRIFTSGIPGLSLSTRLSLSSSRVLVNRARPIHTTNALSSSTAKHSPDTYSKDTDNTPSHDNTINRLDPSSDAPTQRPHDPPSGEWSRAGAKTDEYRHVEGSKGSGGKDPYATKEGSKGNYGATEDWKKQKGSETSGVEDGPEGRSSEGRKP